MNTFSIVLASADRTAINDFLANTNLKDYAVFQATSLAGLVDIINREMVDLAIIDAGISPDLNKTVIVMLKKINRHLQVIVTARDNSPEFELKMRESGLAFYGVHPVDYQAIDGIVEKIRNRKQGHVLSY